MLIINTPYMTPDRERSVETGEAAEKLREFHDDSLDPKVNQYARYLAERLNPELVPQGFVMAGALANYDLKEGVNGFTGEPIQNDLVGLPSLEYNKLLVALPDIASRVLPEDFAAEVEEIAKDLLGDAYEIAAQENESDREVISTEITTAEDAERLIIDDAFDRLVALDWQRFGVSTEDVRKGFDMTYPLTLRQAPFQAPITLLVDTKEQERGLLMELLPHQKTHYIGDYWLGLATDKIPPELATLTRDHLFLKEIEGVASTNGLEPREVAVAFSSTPSMKRAAQRMISFMQEHPELFRD